MLLDEPFTGLDDAATEALRGRLADLRAAGCIVLVATHDLETIEGVADRASSCCARPAAAIEPGAGSLRERYRGSVVGRERALVFLGTVWLMTRKDLLIEVRSREIVYTTLFFAVSCVLVFAFGFVREGRPVQDAAAGILWIAIAFSGTLALGRAFERERQSETLRALMMAPVDRPALYVGKLLGILMLLAVVEAIIVPLVALMFQAPLFAHPC